MAEKTKAEISTHLSHMKSIALDIWYELTHNTSRWTRSQIDRKRRASDTSGID